MSAAQAMQDASSGAAISRRHVAHAFGKAAAQYDAYATLQREVADALLTHITQPAPATVFDLGCGTGYCAARLGARFPDAHLVALDLALPMLHASAARLPGAGGFVCGDLQALPFRAAAADLLVSSLALQWCDAQQVFTELCRVLRPGGQALLSTFGPATLRELRAAWGTVDGYVHVNSFPELSVVRQAAQAAALELRAHRALQVRHYPTLRALARELKGIGAHNMNAARPRGLTPRAVFAHVEAEFGKGRIAGLGVPVTWEVLYLDLRKPQ